LLTKFGLEDFGHEDMLEDAKMGPKKRIDFVDVLDMFDLEPRGEILFSEPMRYLGLRCVGDILYAGAGTNQ
jgi:hypothetical protein